MTDATTCIACGTEIRAQTAERHQGKCAICAKGGRRATTSTSKPSSLAAIYSRVRLFLFGCGLTVGGAIVGAAFGYNIFTGEISDSRAFRYVYSPILVLICLLFIVAGVAIVISVFKRSS